MKLALQFAMITAVTNLMLRHGTGDDATLVPASALSIKADVPPAILEELREGLSDVFFEPGAGSAPRVPRLPELAALAWKTEYQGATMVLDLEEIADELDFQLEEDRNNKLRFAGVEVKSVSFEPLPTGAVEFCCNVIVRSDKEGRGQLTALARHKVGITLSKLSQKPLAEPKKPADDAAQAQPELPLTPPGDGSEATSDGKAITPLVH